MADLNQCNEYGVPLHACNGYRQDQHYWVWLAWVSKTHERIGRSADGLLAYYRKKS